MTDLFLTNSQLAKSPLPANDFSKRLAGLQKYDDKENAGPRNATTVPNVDVPAKVLSAKDSGYHGTTDEEVDSQAKPDQLNRTQHNGHVVEVRVDQKTTAEGADRSTSDGSFVSAKENLALGKPLPVNRRLSRPRSRRSSRRSSKVNKSPDDGTTQQQARMQNDGKKAPATKTVAIADPSLASVKDDSKISADAPSTPSDTLSPTKPMFRKSSLNFASLPAREPLANKSLGARSSRTSTFEPSKSVTSSHEQHVTFEAEEEEEETVHADVVKPSEMDKPAVSKQEPESKFDTKAHNLTSTQRLHERINMLNQGQDAGSLEATSTRSFSQPLYPELPEASTEANPPASAKGMSRPISQITIPVQTIKAVNGSNEDDADQVMRDTGVTGYSTQIAHLATDSTLQPVTSTSYRQPTTHRMQNSKVASPSRLRTGLTQIKGGSNLSNAVHSEHQGPASPLGKMNATAATTAAMQHSPGTGGSPLGKRYLDGPLSASKAKLYSVLKSAKGIFASSANVSAQARMEASSPRGSPMRDLNRAMAAGRHQLSSVASLPIPSQIHQKVDGGATEKERIEDVVMADAGSNPNKLATEHDSLNGRVAAADTAIHRTAGSHSSSADALANNYQPLLKPSMEVINEKAADEVMHDQADNVEYPSLGQQQELNSLESQKTQPERQVKRLAKPTRDTAPKTKPAPVSIRVASQMVCKCILSLFVPVLTMPDWTCCSVFWYTRSACNRHGTTTSRNATTTSTGATYSFEKK